MQPSVYAGIARFGPFEVNFERRVLRKRGVRLRLQTQPFQVLAALLEKPGAIVTRDELRRRLWPDDTFVDFEHGLNAAVARLRQALGDSREQPRYIETLTKLGYRFGATVEVEPEDPMLRRRERERCLAEPAGQVAPPPAEPAGSPVQRLTVGRRKELAELEAAFKSVAKGSGVVLCVAGEPGIGKSTLLEDFSIQLRRQGAACYLARGRCSERLAGSEAYLPLLEALESLLHGGDPVAQLL